MKKKAQLQPSGLAERVVFSDGTAIVVEEEGLVTFRNGGVTIAVGTGLDNEPGDIWYPAHRIHLVEVTRRSRFVEESYDDVDA